MPLRWHKKPRNTRVRKRNHNLCGVQVDIVSVSELEASERETRAMLASLPGVDHETVETLMSAGVFSYDDIVEYGLEGLTETAGLQPEMAAHVLDAAKSFVEGKETPAYLKSDGEAEN